jgi:hypothetical protein
MYEDPFDHFSQMSKQMEQMMGASPFNQMASRMLSESNHMMPFSPFHDFGIGSMMELDG